MTRGFSDRAHPSDFDLLQLSLERIFQPYVISTNKETGAPRICAMVEADPIQVGVVFHFDDGGELTRISAER